VPPRWAVNPKGSPGGAGTVGPRSPHVQGRESESRVSKSLRLTQLPAISGLTAVLFACSGQGGGTPSLVQQGPGDGGAGTVTSTPPALVPGNVDGGPAGGAATPAPGPTVTVTTTTGALAGTLEGSTRRFLGVPYAEPPVGPLRFAPPKPVQPWQGARSAERFGAACPQAEETGTVYGLAPLPQSEDCLFLNVYAPADTSLRDLPVMVWIHGGSGLSGTGADYDGRMLSEAGKVVVVTLNYRLGALSSLALPALDAVVGLPSGNLAIRDEQEALRWVQQNIAAFNGDPKNVTLFGESNGSISTCVHVFATGGENLASRYIMQSGGCLGSAVNPASRAQMVATSQDVVTALCPNASDVVKCLRELPADKLAHYKNTRSNVIEQVGGLHVDGQLLPAHPAKLVVEGRFNKKPILLGTNRFETRFLAAPAYGEKWPLVTSSVEYGIGVTAMYPDAFVGILGHYGLPSDAAANDTLTGLMDDGWFRCAARALARGVSAAGADVFLYSFELAPAVHTQEIDYVFGFPDARMSKMFDGAPVPPDPTLTKAMQSYWLSFARTGNPNAAGMPNWPKYDVSSDEHLTLDKTISTSSRLGAKDCDFWDSVLVTPNK
jgi:para-nitrobenzyl esterase